MTSWYAFPNPLLRARRNLYHPLAPSHAPRLQTPLCARALYTATARILVHAGMPYAPVRRTLSSPPLAGPQSSCASTKFELGNDWRRYPHQPSARDRGLLSLMRSVRVVWGAVVVTGAVFPSVTSLQRVPRRAPPMHCRAMFTHAVTPELLVMVSQMVCMCCGGRVGASQRENSGV